MRIFLAGASGAIGRRLMPLLLAAGHRVTGMTRSADAARKLEAAGVRAGQSSTSSMQPRLQRVAIDAQPEVVVHQLTDLPQSFDEKALAASYPRNARIRVEGTRNLIAAARAAGARRFIVQSIAFAYAAGREPHVEDDPLNLADGPRAGNGARRRRYGTTSPCVRHGSDRASLRPALRPRHVERRPKPQAARCISMLPPRRRCLR